MFRFAFLKIFSPQLQITAGPSQTAGQVQGQMMKHPVKYFNGQTKFDKINTSESL
jgi:hypothetical protein